MTGKIGEFKITMGKDASGVNRIPTSGNIHYIIMLNSGWEQASPLKFHNGYLDDLRNRFSLTGRIPLPSMPHFFSDQAEGDVVFQGRHILHFDAALRDQPLFSHFEKLKDLVQLCLDRKIIYADFISSLDSLAIPVSWRNDIVNGLWESAPTPVNLPFNSPAITAIGKARTPATNPPKSSSLDDILSMMGSPEAIVPDTEQTKISISPKDSPSTMSSHLGALIHEIGNASTGFILKPGAAKELHQNIIQSLTYLKSSLLTHKSLAEILGFLASLQRLSKVTKGRDKQSVHLWSEIPSHPQDLLIGENIDEGNNFPVVILLLDFWKRDEKFLRDLDHLAMDLNCPILLQMPDNISLEAKPSALDEDSKKALACLEKSTKYLFAGGVASTLEDPACIFRPAAMGFLEGLIAAKETVGFYEHRSLNLEDQDVFVEKGQGRSTDRLLDQGQIIAWSEKKMNRVNGARNQSIATFPLLTAWEF